MGGQLGYLALVISPADYISIPNATNFQWPTEPGIFDAAAAPEPVLQNNVAITIAEIATQKIAHNKRLRQYHERQAVKMVLRNHIISVIEADYLQPIHNMHMNMMNETIPEIISFLSNTYGQLSPAQLKEREKAIDDMVDR